MASENDFRDTLTVGNGSDSGRRGRGEGGTWTNGNSDVARPFLIAVGGGTASGKVCILTFNSAI